jgi:hypothetical protein
MILNNPESIFRRSGNRFAVENATKQEMRAVSEFNRSGNRSGRHAKCSRCRGTARVPRCGFASATELLYASLGQNGVNVADANRKIAAQRLAIIAANAVRFEILSFL